MRVLAALCGLILSLLCLTPVARADTELVLILDNSGSMIDRSRMTGPAGETWLAAADPDRLGIMATLMIRELLDPGDQLTILVFNRNAPNFRQLPNEPTAIRELVNDSPTLFRGVLAEAHRILTTTGRERRLLLLLTDGAPSDIADPREAQQLLGLTGGPTSYDVLALGLAADDGFAQVQSQFLAPLAQAEGSSYIRVNEPQALLTRFTEAYASTLGSKPAAGTLPAGGSWSFEVGRYVSEVMVMAASTERVGPFAATVARDGAEQRVQAQGDNGCSYVVHTQTNPRLCQAPFHHYMVWKVDNDPHRATTWRLDIDGAARSDVTYGVILRYDLAAEVVSLPDQARAGEAFEIEGRIVFEGETFDDEPFFSADGFEAYAMVAGEKVPLSVGPDAVFRGSYTAQAEGALPVELVFENRWVRLAARAPDVLVSGWPDLSLAAQPLELGRWQGDWQPTEGCANLDISGSQNPGSLPLELLLEAAPEGVQLTVDGVPAGVGRPLALAAGAHQLPVCVVAPRCCGPLDGSEVKLALRAQHPRYADRQVPVEVRLAVDDTGWLRCWWPVLAAIAAALFLIWLIYGFLSPHDFETEAAVRFSRKERTIQRARRLSLRQLPGGKRGFYRNATVGLDASGTPLAARRKALVRLTAGVGGEVGCAVSGTLEVKNPRNRKWEPVEAERARAGLRRRVLHRVGDFHFQIE